jgi:alpha-glucosidase
MARATLLAWTAAVALTLSGCSRSHTESIAVDSPSGRVRITASVGNGGVSYAIERAEVAVITPSPIEIRLQGLGGLAANAALVGVTNQEADQTGTLPWGKVARVRNHYRGVTVHLRSASGTRWDLELRAYDAGAALRYGLPDQPALHDFVIEDEATEFHLAGSPTLTFGTLENFTTSHEPVYQTTTLARVPAGTLIEMPTLAVWPDGRAAAITEARLRGFAGMYLERPDASATFLRSRLSPLPGRPTAAVVARAPHWSPWRSILLGDRAGALVESTMLLALNDDAAGDFSWARPGKTTFHWWNGVVEHGTASTPDINFAIHKKYIDFCAAHGIAYHSVIGIAGNRPWYVQSGASGYDPRPDTDILTPRPDLGLPRILEYARSKNVGIRFWVYWKPLKDHFEAAFTRYEQWGIKGLMIDFLDRDDQEMVEWQERVLQSAARHHLHVQFHGSYKPSGEQRTYPNLFNREGVLNLEYLKWDDRCTPQHDVDVAYTRALAGPLDYHLGGFRAAPRDRFKPHELLPDILGTRAHQLGLYVVFENPMPMVADDPDAYANQPGFDFLEDVPTTWEDTRFVAGEPGQFIVVARRRGDRWYLGGINNWTSRALELPLLFLGPGDYDARISVDDRANGSDPNALRQETRTVAADKPLTVMLASGGGVVAVLQRKVGEPLTGP